MSSINTEEGEGRSAMSTLRHGLLAKHSTLELEPAENFDVILHDHLYALPPADGIQLGLIEEMTAAQWRMRRLRALENGMLNQAIRRTPVSNDSLTRIIDGYSMLAESRRFNNLGAYEGRLSNRYFRALNAFLKALRPSQKQK